MRVQLEEVSIPKSGVRWFLSVSVPGSNLYLLLAQGREMGVRSDFALNRIWTAGLWHLKLMSGKTGVGLF